MRAKTGCLGGASKGRKKAGRLLLRALSWLLLPALAVSGLIFRPGAARGEEFIVSGEDDGTSLSGAARVILGTMTLEEKVFQMFFVTPEQLTGDAYTSTFSAPFASALKNFPVGGLFMFGQNITSGEALRTMNEQAYAWSLENMGIGFFMGVAEEGGSVQPLATKVGLDRIPPAALMTEEDAREWGNAAGQRLKEYGFNLDLAPEADLYDPDGNTEIGDRSFSADSSRAATCALLFSQGLKDQGVISVFKHFPGIGSVGASTRLGRGSIGESLAEIRSRAMIPFYSAVWNQAGMIQVTAISCDAVEKGVPACLSYGVVTGILREELGYTGVIVTDSLRNQFVTSGYTSGNAAVAAIQAGCDMLFLPKDLSAAVRGVLMAVRVGKLSESRIDESVERILVLKLKYHMINDDTVTGAD